jgi:hypothetical protein
VSDEQAGPDYGPVTVDDLRARADTAYEAHKDTFTATHVLHSAFMSKPYDDGRCRTVDAACQMIVEWRERVTRPAWHRAHRAWATLAGVEIPPSMRDDPTDGGGGE